MSSDLTITNPLTASFAPQTAQKSNDTTAAKVVLVLQGSAPLTYSLAPPKEDPQATLSRAIDERDLPKIETLVTTHKLSLETRDDNGMQPLLVAVRGGDLELAQTLIRLGASKKVLDEEDECGQTPLTECVENGALAQVEILIQLGADPNKMDKKGNTPLTLATKKKNAALMKALKGADVHLPNGAGKPPIFIAIDQNDFDSAEVLVKDLKCKLNFFQGGAFPLEYAYYTGKFESWEKFLAPLGADSQLVTEYLARQLLANVWSHSGATQIRDKEGNTHTLPYIIGLPDIIGKAWLHNFLNAFCENNPNFTKAEQEALDEIVKEALYPDSRATNAEVVERMKADKPTVIFTGVDDPAHSVSFVVTKDRLYVCNRGADRDVDYGMRVYKLEPYMRQELLIERLRATYPDTNSFNTMFAELPSELANKPATFELLPKESKKRSKQSDDNCVWATSAKGSVDALFAHYKKDPDLYKQFTAFTRKQGLEIYFAETVNPDIPLLTAIGTHLAKKAATKKHYDTATDAIFAKLLELTGIDFKKVKK